MPAMWAAGQGSHPAPVPARTVPVLLPGTMATQNAGHAKCQRFGCAKDSPEPCSRQSPAARIPPDTRCAQKTLDRPRCARALPNGHQESASTERSTNTPIQVLVYLAAVLQVLQLFEAGKKPEF